MNKLNWKNALWNSLWIGVLAFVVITSDNPWYEIGLFVLISLVFVMYELIKRPWCDEDESSEIPDVPQESVEKLTSVGFYMVREAAKYNATEMNVNLTNVTTNDGDEELGSWKVTIKKIDDEI